MVKKANKDVRINIRLTEEDLALLKKRAEQEGMPHQTLVGSVLHRYLTGTLVNVDDIKSILRSTNQ